MAFVVLSNIVHFETVIVAPGDKLERAIQRTAELYGILDEEEKASFEFLVAHKLVDVVHGHEAAVTAADEEMVHHVESHHKVCSEPEALETRLAKKEEGNSKFSFLHPNDKYHGYYKNLLTELREGTVSAQEGDPVPEAHELRFIVDPGKVSALDLDMMKLAAQFVAVNGDSFIEQLEKHVSSDKKQSLQFEFLRPSHSLHKVFERYLGSYRLILEEEGQIKQELDGFSTTRFLDRCYVRAGKMAEAKEEESRQKQRLEKEQLEFASIDWQDFVVVETIEFSEVDEVAQLGVPLDRGELEYRSLVDKGEEAEEEEEEEDEEEEIPTYDEQKPSTPDTPTVTVRQGMKIRSAGESRLKRKREETKYSVDAKSGERQVVCPLTGQLIPESRFGQHLSILLRDPNNQSLDLWSLGVLLLTLNNLSSNDELSDIILLGQTVELSDVVGSLRTQSLWNLSIGQTLDLLLTLLNNNKGQDSKVVTNNTASDRLSLSLSGSSWSVTGDILGQEQFNSVWDHHTLLHWETLLVVTTSDLEDVALELIAHGISLDLLAHSFFEESSQFVFIFDVNTLLSTVGWVSDVQLHG
ncbi:hypothetical protein OGAPHI_006171 [Ogataea philodendri]|uniref:SURP motif domain-containing protein n=1 Tax=Ogataea philodendri TaxID=1378263 RepID=A0A9P8NYS6_9ASCO|nr:uncharacterized protein OGAPHI_006171 [Ogataea philodendri]KAH3661990.1 hypothetical protein OGAPHI_006171 [Ogataea philodendri]